MYMNDGMVQKMRLVVREIKTQFWTISYIELGDDEGGEVTEITPLFKRAKVGDNNDDKNKTKETKLSIKCDNFGHAECVCSPWNISAPHEVLRWPITFLLWCTIPDCRRYQKFYILTFIICITWILILSYLIASMIAIVGEFNYFFYSLIKLNKIKLDDIVGFLFLGAGTSIPEAVSSVMVSMQGNANIGINNAIASNIYDILFCLGVSWLARILIGPLVSGTAWVSNNLFRIEYLFT